MSDETLEMFDELALEIAACQDPEERELLENTLTFCREMAYAMTEGLVEAEEDEDGEIRFYPVEA